MHGLPSLYATIGCPAGLDLGDAVSRWQHRTWTVRMEASGLLGGQYRLSVLYSCCWFFCFFRNVCSQSNLRGGGAGHGVVCVCVCVYVYVVPCCVVCSDALPLSSVSCVC